MLATGDAVVLHEHKVPDLDRLVPRTIDVFAPIELRIVRIIAKVIVDFRARAAGTGLTHLPEVVLAAKSQNTIWARANGLPESLSLVVRRNFVIAGKDGKPEALGIHSELIYQQVPRELDGILLEVVTKRKVAEHLEERVMPGGLSDLIQVVVLSAGSNTLLRGGGRL